MNPLSIAALLISYLYVVGFLGVMYYSSGRHRDRSTRLWIFANALTLFTLVAFSLDERRFGPWVVVFRNVLMATAALSVVYVLLSVTHRAPATWLFATALAVYVVLIVYDTLIVYNVLQRILTFSYFSVLISAYCIYELQAAYRQDRNRNYLLFLGAFVGMIVAYLYRISFVLTASDRDAAAIQQHSFLVGLLVNAAFLLLWNVVLYVLLSQRGEAV